MGSSSDNSNRAESLSSGDAKITDPILSEENELQNHSQVQKIKKSSLKSDNSKFEFDRICTTSFKKDSKQDELSNIELMEFNTEHLISINSDV